MPCGPHLSANLALHNQMLWICCCCCCRPSALYRMVPKIAAVLCVHHSYRHKLHVRCPSDQSLQSPHAPAPCHMSRHRNIILRMHELEHVIQQIARLHAHARSSGNSTAQLYADAWRARQVAWTFANGTVISDDHMLWHDLKQPNT